MDIAKADIAQVPRRTSGFWPRFPGWVLRLGMAFLLLEILSGVAAARGKASLAATAVQSLNGIARAEQFSGDAGARIIAAIASMPGGGVVDARALTGAQAATTTINIPAKVTLLLGSIVLTSSASGQAINLQGTGAGVYGSGRNTTRVIATGSGANAINISGGTRGVVISDMQIETSGTAANTVQVQDNTGDLTLRDLELRPVVDGVHAVPGVNGGLMIHLDNVRSDGGRGASFRFDFSHGTLWTNVLFENTYADASGIGYDIANITGTFVQTASDLCAVNYRIGDMTGRHLTMLGINAEGGTTGVQVNGGGTIVIVNPFFVGEQLPIDLVGPANVTIINPVSLDTHGSYTVVARATATGANSLLGSAGLDKAISEIAPGGFGVKLGRAAQLTGPVGINMNGTFDLDVNNPTKSVQQGFWVAGVNKARVGIAASPGNIAGDSASGDFVARTEGGAYRVSIDGGSSTRFLVNASGAVVPGTHGESWGRGSLSENITLSTSSATTDSSANLLPANSVIESVVCRVTTTITAATDWSVGDSATPARFSSANRALNAGTTSVGLNHMKRGVSTDAGGPTQAAAAKLRLTTTGIPSAGAIRCTTFYSAFVPPAN